MFVLKTRTVYGKDKNSGKIYLLCADSVDASLKKNMLVREYEKKLAADNPDLEIIVKITNR